MCIIFTATSAFPVSGGDSGGGSLPVTELFSQLFSTDVTSRCVFSSINVHSLFLSIIFTVLVGSPSTVRSQFMSIAFVDTQVKICSKWDTSLTGDTN